MSESTYDILWSEDSRSPETLLLQAESRISALEAALAKADELAGACDALHSQAHKSMTGGHGHMIDDAAHTLTAYRKAKDATT